MRKVLASDWGEQPERVLERIDTNRQPRPASVSSIAGGRTTAVRWRSRCNIQGSAEPVEADMRNLRLLSPLMRS
jgi:hypothetical protein